MNYLVNHYHSVGRVLCSYHICKAGGVGTVLTEGGGETEGSVEWVV